MVATIAMLLFAAATQGWFLTRNRIHETLLLLLVAFTLFRPGFWMDMISPPYDILPPAQIDTAVMSTPPGALLRLRIDGLNDLGDPISFVALLPVGEGDTAEDRLLASGLELITQGDTVIVDNATFGSPAQDAGFDWDQRITQVLAPLPQPSKYWMFLPALLVLGGIILMQRRRLARASTAARA